MATSTPNDPTEGSAIARSLVSLLRIKQWAKNALIFAAWLFTGSRFEGDILTRVLVAFLAMCLASSATYVFNDLVDVERDRNHPKKRFRPIASGAVPVQVAVVAGVVLVALALALAAWLNPRSLALVVFYLLLQVAYNVALKRTTLADVYTIALGFVLRAVLGATAIDVGISPWLLFCTGTLALMLGFAKRRSEFVNQGEARAATRESLATYSLKGLDMLVGSFSTAAMLSYALYCIDSPTAKTYPSLPLTAVPVFYGVSRYLLVVFTAEGVEDPTEALYKDRHILVALLAYLATALFAIAGPRLPFFR